MQISNARRERIIVLYNSNFPPKKTVLVFNLLNMMESMKIIFDKELTKKDFFIDFQSSTKESNIKHNIETQLVEKSITWKRQTEGNSKNQEYTLYENTKTINENHIMIIWDCEETVRYVSNNLLVSAIANIQKVLPHKKIFLVIYKIENYFKYLKSIKQREIQDDILQDLSGTKQKKTKTKNEKHFSNLPRISKNKLEEYLVEIQLTFGVSSRFIENSGDMVLLINQYTKSLALLPTKTKQRIKESQIDWFAKGDNRDTVKVDKDGNGLKRLWQQQLCQFTLMSLETSEAISSIYKSPIQLMEAYKKCTPAEGEMLLKDIPIRRAAGPLTSVRKVGPELSKKLYIMFTSEDGEVYLND